MKQLGLWEDINTGKLANIVKIADDVVWYEIPEFTIWLSCAADVFFSVMRKVQ